MIEKTVLEHLRRELGQVPVYMEYPDEKETTFVVIEKTGSGITNGIRSATIAVQSLADSLYNAAVLNEKVKVAMDDLITNDEIGRVSLDSDYNFTDTQTKHHRYQAVYQLVHY